MTKRKLEFVNIIFLSFFITAIDQASKYFVFHELPQGETFYILPRFIRYTLVKNTGAAFSLLSQHTELLTILSITATIFITIWIYKNQPFPILQGTGFGFLLGGTIGNGIDRLSLGYVRDFIELTPLNFPVFNIADLSINIAIVFLIFNALRKK
tara:strand:- start:207 stop:668 length:462 start_codon:yes stop_codon:yes gene_type:complete